MVHQENELPYIITKRDSILPERSVLLIEEEVVSSA